MSSACENACIHVCARARDGVCTGKDVLGLGKHLHSNSHGHGSNLPGWGQLWIPNLVLSGGPPATHMQRYREAIVNGDAEFKLHVQSAWDLCNGFACVGAEALVVLADGSLVPARKLVVGQAIRAPGHTTVLATWRAYVGRETDMVELHGVPLTPDHPVWEGGAWHRPDELCQVCCIFHGAYR